MLLYVQDEDEVEVHTPEITQRVHHATDEEKLASTCTLSQTINIPEEREEPECIKASANKQPVSEISVDSKFSCDICVGRIFTLMKFPNMSHTSYVIRRPSWVNAVIYA